ncbi:MAG: hypothetical protein IKW06_02790 [Clostridia bacterium]|nr:hypothetical protein [Clostridia bacterium]
MKTKLLRLCLLCIAVLTLCAGIIREYRMAEQEYKTDAVFVAAYCK